ncbi:MBOAT family O-acyltransferase [Aquibium sp. LZ166]|uniref:Probable alginate O-acetylase AlgI n=1 Tax=Aquibium pacificus TaxID=3153579 RepID=A0ABV3SD65_9HYPH
MVFSSPTFLYVFLPVFLVIYFAAGSLAWRNAVLIGASLLFYAWGEPVFVFVLLASIVVNWRLGLAISGSAGAARRRWLSLGIAANLVMLGAAKYADMAMLTLGTLFPASGVAPIGIPLPLGVSFFTFQAMSYLVDVYRRDARAEPSLAKVALYISMFPQLVAGPIVRYRTVAAQMSQRRTTLWRAATGARIFAIGLAQKVLIANEVGISADMAFSFGPDLDLPEAWLGLASYTLQIYFDFAGYSNMAIGIGLALGFGFPRNFDMPYASGSVTEFWRRWHISLSRWFRDYLYFPLGGSREGAARTYLNLVIVFLLCGLWHGAAWTFVAWGAWHGALLVLERAFLLRILARLPALARHVYLLLVVMLGWVLFRADGFAAATTYFSALAGGQGNGQFDPDFASLLTPYWSTVFVLGVLLSTVRIRPLFASRRRDRAVTPVVAGARRLAKDVGIWLLLLFSMVGIAGAGNNPFLYFRF